MSKKNFVGASDIGKVAFCPYSAYLDAQGYKPSKQELENKERGNQFHNQYNSKMLQHDNSQKISHKPLFILILIIIALAGLYL